MSLDIMDIHRYAEAATPQTPQPDITHISIYINKYIEYIRIHFGREALNNEETQARAMDPRFAALDGRQTRPTARARGLAALQEMTANGKGEGKGEWQGKGQWQEEEQGEESGPPSWSWRSPQPWAVPGPPESRHWAPWTTDDDGQGQGPDDEGKGKGKGEDRRVDTRTGKGQGTPPPTTPPPALGGPPTMWWSTHPRPPLGPPTNTAVMIEFAYRIDCLEEHGARLEGKVDEMLEHGARLEGKIDEILRILKADGYLDLDVDWRAAAVSAAS